MMNRVSPPYFPHSWAVAWGQDQYGVWEEFQFQDVVQRMRWIMPGTFKMGPTRSEVGNFDEVPSDWQPLDGEEDDPQHSVTLTQGFWLADTTCTQELWQAVMGENPSRIHDAKGQPVDSGSWGKCPEL